MRGEVDFPLGRLRVSRARGRARTLEIPGWISLSLGMLSLVFAHWTRLWTADPAGADPLIWTAVAVVTAVAAVTAGAALVVVAVESEQRYVFRYRRLAQFTAALALLAAFLIVRMVFSPPFAHVAADGRVTAQTLVDVGCVVVAFACVMGVALGLVAAMDARRDERQWSADLWPG